MYRHLDDPSFVNSVSLYVTRQPGPCVGLMNVDLSEGFLTSTEWGGWAVVVIVI